MQSRMIALDPPHKLAVAGGATGKIAFVLDPDSNTVWLTVSNCSPPFQRDQAATGMMGLPARALVMACSAVRPCKRPVAITEAAAA